jgi:hypothetical protein
VGRVLAIHSYLGRDGQYKLVFIGSVFISALDEISPGASWFASRLRATFIASLPWVTGERPVLHISVYKRIREAPEDKSPPIKDHVRGESIYLVCGVHIPTLAKVLW